MRTLALLLLALAGCSDATPVPDAGTDTPPPPLPFDAGTVAEAGTDAPRGDVGCPADAAVTCHPCPAGYTIISVCSNGTWSCGCGMLPADAGPGDAGCVPACGPGQVCMAGVCFAPVGTDAGVDVATDATDAGPPLTSCYGTCSTDADCEAICHFGSGYACCINGRCGDVESFAGTCDGIRSGIATHPSQLCMRLWVPACQSASDCAGCAPPPMTPWLCRPSTTDGGVALCHLPP